MAYQLNITQSEYEKKIVMKKILLISTVLLAFSSTVTAQEYNKGFRLGIGLNGGFPTDSDYEGSVGGDLRLQYDFSRKTSMTLTSGYTHMFVKGDDFGFVPVKLGVKHFLGNQFYLMGEAGMGLGVMKAIKAASDKRVRIFFIFVQF